VVLVVFLVVLGGGLERRDEVAPWPVGAEESQLEALELEETFPSLLVKELELLPILKARRSLEPRNLYVAASRARLRLHVFVKEGVVVPEGGA
jgi:hypothetical protein